METIKDNDKEIRMTKLKNAIRTIASTDAKYLREGLSQGLNILFYENGNKFIFGVDSHYSMQVNGSWNTNKSQVLEYLRDELNFNLKN